MKLCSLVMSPSTLDTHRSSVAGSAVSTLTLTVMVWPVSGCVLVIVILFPGVSCPDASRNTGFHSG